MYVFFVSLVVFAALCVASLLVTFALTVLNTQSSRHPEPVLNNVIMVQLSLLTTTLFDAAGDVVAQTTSTGFGFASNVLQNTKRLAQIGAVVALLLLVSNNTGVVLTTGDTCWRCIFQPLFQNVVLSVAQIVRVIYDGLIPLYNFNYVVLSQATSGTAAIAIKCDLSTVVDTIRLVIETFVAGFQSVFFFTGAGGMSFENNIFVNEWNVTEIAVKTQDVLQHQQNISECVCEGLKDVIDIAFTVTKQRELPRAINHAVNLPLSVAQTVFQLLPLFGPRFPTLNKPLYHLNGFTFNLMKYFDRVLEDGLKKSVRLFVDDFEFEGLPKEFIFTTAGRSVMGFYHALHTVYRSLAHIMLPIPLYITDVDYMMKAFRMDQAIREFDLVLLNTANIGYWFLEIADKFSRAVVESVKTGEEVQIVGIPKHVRLDCLPSDKWTVTAACIPYLAASSGLNLFYIGNNLLGELLWKSVFTNKQNVVRTLQRYDGPSYPRNEAITCQYRKFATWDLSTDPRNCKCDIPDGYQEAVYTEEHPFGVPIYDPWCGQPNLNANYFGNAERVTQLLASGAGIADNYKELTKTGNLLLLEYSRTVIKTLLNFEDILRGRFFDRKINCGYGVSEERLEKWWTDAGNYILPCYPEKPGHMYTSDGCVPIHEHMRLKMCSVTRNAKQNQPGALSTCSGENRQGCACNIALPLDATSLCACNYFFPDTPQEIAQQAFENEVLDLTYEHSEHWCGTYHLEWFLFYTDRLAFAVDKFFEDFHPAYNTQENSYCEDASYELTKTSILHQSKSQFNEDKELYDALAISYSSESCKLYGAHDLICSASMTVRSGVRLITYEIRELAMTMFEIIGGNTDGVTVNFGNRLCDMQRTAAGIASTLPYVSPAGFVLKDLRVGVAKVLFSVLDLPIEGLNMLNHAVQFFMRILQGTAGFSTSAQQPVFDFVIAEFDIVINWVRLVIDGLADLFESVHRGAGGLLRTFDQIIVIFRNLLTDAAIEMISLIFKVVGGVVEMFTGGGVYTDFFTDLWKLITKGIVMILKNAGKVLEAILKMMGPVGSFIRDMASTICKGIQDVLCFLTAGDFCDMGCIGHGASSRRLHGMHRLPNILHESMAWNGTSTCDLLVNEYKGYNFSTMRPIERVQLVKCAEERALAVEMQKQTGLPIPVDIVYNWRRKYEVMHSVLTSGIIYGQYAFGEMDNAEMVSEMKQAGVDTDLYLPLWNKARVALKRTLTFSHLDSFVHSVFHSFDGNIKTSDTGWGNVYRIYAHAAKAAKAVYNHTSTVDLKQQVSATGKALAKVNFTLPSLNVSSTFRMAQRATVRSSVSRAPHRLRARSFVLHAAGLNTDITPCAGKVCINCVVVDNFINTFITEGDRMAAYYEHTYVPVVLPSFTTFFSEEDKDARAWREDVGKMMDEAATSSKKIKLRSTSNTTLLTNWQRAVKDWDHLFAEWEVRNGVPAVTVLSDFVSVTDDSYVPFFAHSASWFITYPFAGSCPMEIIYCERDKTTDRLVHISTSLRYMLYFGLAVFAVDWFTSFPLLALVSPFMPYIVAFIFLLTTYGWTVPCFPNVPNCLVDDLYSYANDVLFPKCFCSYFPALAETCSEECFLCSVQTSFKSCPESVPDLATLGVFWAPLTFLRVNYPEMLVFLYNTAPFLWLFRRIESLDTMFQHAIYRTPLSMVETDCYNLHLGDLVVFLAAGYGASVVLQFVVPIFVRVLQHGLKVFVQLVGLFYTMAVSIELSTVRGVKNTYQKEGL